MHKIEQMAIVSQRDVCKFVEDMRVTIDTMQDDGLEVEVQYQPVGDLFTAVLIGRKDKMTYAY